MKKFMFLAAALAILGVGSASAELVETPKSVPLALQTPAYGGVDYATASFLTSFATACLNCQGVLNSVLISSTPNNDFVDVFDSSITFPNPGDEKLIWRVYAGTQAASGGSYNGGSGTQRELMYPIRFNAGLVFRASVGTLNKVTLGYWKRR